MNQLPMIAEDPQHGMHHFQQHQHAHHQQQQQQQQPYHHDTNESESNSDDDNSPSEHKMDQQSSGKLFTPHKQAAPLVIQWLEENYENYEEGTLPRSTVYSHYDLFCNSTNLERLNAASFGKLIRNVFPNLKTRRLGTRGNSKYHYYGIRVKTTSDLNNISSSSSSSLKHDTQQTPSSSSASSFGFNNTPGSSLAPTTGAGLQQLHASSSASSPSSTSSSSSSSTPLLVSMPGSSVPSGVKGLQKQNGASAFKSAHILNPLSTPVSAAQPGLLDDDDLISNNTPEQFVAGTFGENSLSFQLPLFNFQTSSLKLAQTASSLQTTTEALVESLKLMMNNYRLFCQNFLDIAYRQVYPELEELCKTFWKNVHHFIKVMLHNESVVGVIIEKDEILFATILSTLLPSLLQPTKPSAQLKAFFKKFCNLMKTSLEGYPPEPFVSRKMQATRSFANNVRRQLNLHSLGFDLSLLLKNPTSISKALIDFNNIDFDFVFQASPHIFSPCDLPIVRAIHDDIKAFLSQPKDFEQWIQFLLDCLLKAMKKVTSFNPKQPSSSSSSEYSYESLIQAAQYIAKTLSCFHLLLHSEVPSSRLVETSPLLLIYSFVIEFLMFVSPFLAKHQSIHILALLSNQLPPNVIITRVSDLDHQAFTQQQQQHQGLQQHQQQAQHQQQQHHQGQSLQQSQQQQGQQQQQSHYGQQQQLPQQQFQHAQYLQQQQHVSQYPGGDNQMYFSQGYPQQQQQRSQQHTSEGQASYGNQVSMPSQPSSSILSQGFLVDRQQHHQQQQQQQQGQNFGDYSRLLSQPQNQQTQWSSQLPTPSITTDHLSLRSPFLRQDFPTPSYMQSNSTFSGSTLLPSTSSLSQQTSAPSLMSKLEDPFYSRSAASSSSNPNNNNGNNNGNNNNMFYQPTSFRSATGGSNSPPLLAAIGGGASLLNTSAPPSTPPHITERRAAIFPGDRLSNQSSSADQMTSGNNNNGNNSNSDTSPPRSTTSVPPGAKPNLAFSSLSHRQYQGGYGAENEGSAPTDPVPVSDRFSGFATMDYGRPGSGNSGIFLFSTDPEQRASTGFLESPSGPSSVDLSSGASDDPMSDKSKLYDRGSYSNSKLR